MLKYSTTTPISAEDVEYGNEGVIAKPDGTLLRIYNSPVVIVLSELGHALPTHRVHPL